MLGQHGRNIPAIIFRPIVNFLYNRQVSPNTVTIVGTLISCILSLITIPFGHAWQGAILLGIILFSDSIDGLLARKMGISSPYGAFLDSVLDRISDGIIFVSITIYCRYYMTGMIGNITFILALFLIILSGIVPYIRAKGQSYKAEPKIGMVERTDRLIISLVALGFSDIGLGQWILMLALFYLVAASIYTVYQRIMYVKEKLG